MTPKNKKICPLCKGTKRIYIRDNRKFDSQILTFCKECDENGEVYNYLTPEQWEAETGEKLLDSDPVWEYITQRVYDSMKLYSQWTLVELSDSSYNNTAYKNPVVVARPGQPKPPEDYRP